MYCYGTEFVIKDAEIQNTEEQDFVRNIEEPWVKKGLIAAVGAPFLLIFEPELFVNIELAIWPGYLLMMYIYYKGKMLSN